MLILLLLTKKLSLRVSRHYPYLYARLAHILFFIHFTSRSLFMEAELNGPTGRTPLGPGPLTMGRMPGSQMLLTDPQSSGHHAEIRPEGQGYSIIDLGSTNGTFVNEQRLTPHSSRMLVSGDRVRIGGTVFSYEAREPEPFAPTVYGGSPGQGNTPAFEPTVAVPPPVNYRS
ncbi:MAG TPA: hypothetical protein DCL75_02370, partial [Ktedonobacter sp.]|nr:hypothetical protein [Ktedonobacter sp.]